MRDDIKRALEAAGTSMPAQQTITKKVRETHAIIKAIEGADPETQRKVLAATLGKAPFLAVPAAISAGAAATGYGDHDPYARNDLY